MKMKDKLVKFNHKKPYYTMKKCAVAFAVLVAVGGAMAIPLSVTYLEKTPVVPHAEENTAEVEKKTEEIVEEETTSEITEEELLNY